MNLSAYLARTEGGKTTLLKSLLGLLPVQKGEVLLFGQPPEKVSHQIGYVPQSIRFDKLFPISTFEVVLMGCLHQLSWWGGFSKEVKKRASEALEQVNLGHKRNAPFGTLSGGEAQRALIARAIVSHPRLLILDEPTANVDVEAESAIYDLLLQLKESMTILMVTHHLQAIVEKVERLLCVQRGVTSLKAKEVCEHFALGLYHTPLTAKRHFTL